MPRRIQLKRTRGWTMPKNTVSVARPTKWGNPMRGDRTVATAWFRHAISRFPVPSILISEWAALGGKTVVLIALAGRVKEVLAELRGKNLACYCPPDQPCHADVLLEIANSKEANNGKPN